MNVGNLDIETSAQTVTLRIRHVVRGYPGATLTRGEVAVLIGKLEQILKTWPAAPPAEDDEDLIG